MIIRTSLVTCIVFIAGISLAEEPARKVIEWGWDEPDTKFIRENIGAMEQHPFDGLIFHVTSSKGGNFTWEMWGGRKYDLDEFQHSIDNLKATNFQRFTDRFLRVNVTPGTTDWFDDEAWGTVLNNFGVAAQVAKQGGCKGFMFDVEQYNEGLFDYGKQKRRDSKTSEEYGAKIRQRGREWMAEVNRHFPDITVLLTFGYRIAQPPEGKERSASHYGLLADFLDGMLEACSEDTKIVDAWEYSYPYKERKQFEEGYKTVREKSVEWTAAPDKYRRHVQAGFGIWMDCRWRQVGWNLDDFSENHFTPAEFETAVRTALDVSDEYVWIYTEQPRWWTNERLPTEYVSALKHARREKQEAVEDVAAEVTIREVDGPIDHNHCTTRQFQHMSFCHEGTWFVFYSDGRDFRYQTSIDSGKSWAAAERPVATAPNGSSSHDVLQVGNMVYLAHAFYPLGRYDVNAPYAKDPARRGEYTHEGRIKRGRIEGRRIRWLQDVNPGFTPDYCNLVQDSNGYFWIFTREDQQGTAHRSSNTNAIDSWEPESICLPVKGRHALDAAALDDGLLYVVSLLTTDGKLYGNLYDGRDWGATPVLIADDLTTVAGDDRRLAIEFDPTHKRLHVIYVDVENRLRYRHLDSPYGRSDWQPTLSQPGLELASGVFTCALSVDSSSMPYGLVITYGLEKHVGKDKRQRTGELYARRFEGQEWRGKSILVSQPGTIHNWYPNVNQDVREGLCVLYSRSKDREHLGVPLAVMVSVGRFLHPRPRPETAEKTE